VVAGELGWNAEVTLKAPPPLDTPMEVRPGTDGTVAVFDGETEVAQGRAVELELDVPGPVTLEQADAAKAACPWLDAHPFPTCFACGPDRDPGDGLRQFTSPVDGLDGIYATSWEADPTLADAEGNVAPVAMWAALDCPTSVVITGDPRPHVLGRLAARLFEPAPAAEPLISVAWPVETGERKSVGGSAIYTADGRLCAYSRGTWVALRDPSTHEART
jgi:hypothetical protein